MQHPVYYTIFRLFLNIYIKICNHKKFPLNTQNRIGYLYIDNMKNKATLENVLNILCGTDPATSSNGFPFRPTRPGPRCLASREAQEQDFYSSPKP